MRSLFIIVSILAFSCQQSEGPRFATDTIYYLQVVDRENSTRSAHFTDQLNSEIPKFKYTITHSSGPKGWPFYDTFKLDAKLPVDSIMPPHLIFHAFEIYSDKMEDKIEDGSYLVKAELQPPSEDGSTVLKFQMFERTDKKWVRVVDLVKHPFEISKYPTNEDQYQILKETIVRSSFK